MRGTCKTYKQENKIHAGRFNRHFYNRKFSKPSAGDVHFDMYWKSEANISVGTNAQSLQVYIDPWYATHLNVVGSTANLTFKNSYEYATQRFNSR